MRVHTLMERRAFARALWFVGAVLAGISLVSGAVAALSYSQDFQWSPSKLMWSGVNPYEAFLSGNRAQLILDQVPNYGHLIYLLLLPIAVLPWPIAKLVWLIVNLVMFALLVVKGHSLLPRHVRHWWWVAVVLLCIGYPVKNVLANGQQSLLCLFALGLCYQYRDRPWLAGMALAVVMSKYSFGLFIALVMLVSGYVGVVGVAALVSVCAWLFFAFWTGSDVWACLFQPLQVAQKGVPIGNFDLMSLFRILQEQRDLPPWIGSVLISAVSGAFVAMLWARRRAMRAEPQALAQALGAAVLVSLGTVFHLGYDFTVSLFFVWALLLNVSGQVGRTFMATLGGLFMLCWLLPRFGKHLSVDPFQDARVVAMYAAVLLGAAYWVGLRPLGIQRAGASKAPGWLADVVDPLSEDEAARHS
jgi:hypothetical protein